MPAANARTACCRAAAPARLIDGGIADRRDRRAQVLVSKYADHLPLYRQAQIYARQGHQSRPFNAGRLGAGSCRLALASTARTPTRKAEAKAEAGRLPTRRRRRCWIPAAAAQKPAKFWAYAADDRPWGGTEPPGAAYVYASDRTSERPMSHLEGFVGILQVDGYAGYRKLARRNDVRLASLLVPRPARLLRTGNARRPSPTASEALQLIAELSYAVEKSTSADEAPDERRLARQQKSRPLVDAPGAVASGQSLR